MDRVSLLLVWSVLVFSSCLHGGPQEDHQAKIQAIQSEYFKLSGRKSVPQGTQLEVWHAFPVRGQGHVYMVAARKADRGIVGPYYLIQANGTEVSQYKIELPERLIAVFGATEWDPVAGADSYALESVHQTFAVPVTAYEDKLRLYLSLVPGLPLLPSISVAGTPQPDVEGYQLPWWNWTLADLELTEVADETFSKYVPLALLHEDGTVFAGQFMPRRLLTDIPACDKMRAPANAFQRLYYSLFYPLAANESEQMQAARGFADESQPSGIDFQFQLNSGEPVRLTPMNISVESIGLTRGPHANPEHILNLNIETLEGASLIVGFQNNLPNILNRAIYFASNTGKVSNYQEPIQVWYQPMPVDTLMIPGRGMPVKDGILKIHRFDVDEKDGLLTGLQAELTFTMQSFVVGGKEYSGRGVMRFNLPTGSLLPPFEHFKKFDIRVYRPAYENFYPTEKPDNNRYACPSLVAASA